MSGAQRIVCLSEETTESLYLLGESARIVGISGYTVRPEQARRDKPKVSAFTSAKIEKILALEPDLVIGFSDLQADIASQLIRAGVNVLVTNQRSIDEILQTIYLVGALAGVPEKASALVAELTRGMAEVREAAAKLSRRPRVYFEEWHDPLISGIRWVAELIVLAGGEECFPELKQHKGAKLRIIADPMEVVRRAPDIIIASWCGQKFRPEQLIARPGWDAIAAVRDGQLFEIKSCDILQPGPAALTDGLRQIAAIVRNWAEPRA